MAPLVAGCALVGLVVGSFLNVVVHRVPKRQSVVRPRSRCPGCAAPVVPRDNVPVVSWVLLGGRCRHCRVPIPVRYPMVELGCAGLFALAGWRFGPDPVLVAHLGLFAVLLAVAVIDLEHGIIPTVIVVPAFVVSVVLLAAVGLLEHSWSPLLRALGGAGLVGVCFLVLASLAGVGMGDVRLAPLLGLFLGWQGLGQVGLGLLLSFGFASVVGVGLVVSGVKGRRDPIPFGPFLAAGTLVAVLVGEPVLRWWAELVTVATVLP